MEYFILWLMHLLVHNLNYLKCLTYGGSIITLTKATLYCFFITQLWFMSKLIWQMKWFKCLYWPRLSTSKSNLKLTPYLMSTTNSSISSFLITTPTAPPPLKSPSLKCFFYSFICCFERPVQQDNELLQTHFCGEGNPNDGSIVLWKIKATQIRGSLKSSRLCFLRKLYSLYQVISKIACGS